MNTEPGHPETASPPVRGALSSLAVRIYLAGIALVFFAVLASAALNPRGRRGASWFDDLTLPLGGVSLLICLCAPFFASRPISQRLGFSLLAAAGFAVATVAALAVSMMIFGLPEQD